ncbi:pilus assembly protein CpaB [Paraperlucidibaca baekdonensis]|uniref:Pilus assembly protein CpaB n=1 Tax=Paraperlucidibaca baekdonensis TaxID=748120 RepID=A0A3E0H6Y8_9GAMM|nr:Flp pilus assembly protein CpaB [Paraperlucidibaca baekdonensis]REH39028.1 pilus assembly protein CpaB [Paraperlucidibaca baekdonensis]
MNSRVMLLLALLLVIGAGVAGYLGYKTTEDAKQAALAAEQEVVAAKKQAAVTVTGKEPVVVLKQDVSLFDTLSADDLTIDYLKVAPPRSFRKIDEVVGQLVHAELQAGAILELGHLQPGSDVARLLRVGERAVAIPIDEVVGGGGFVQPGDLVDVLLFLRGQQGAKDSAQIAMQSLRVIGFGAEIISATGAVETAEAKSGRRAAKARARTAVLAVTEKDAPRLLLASSLGTLRLAIRPTAENLAAAQEAMANEAAKSSTEATERVVGSSVAKQTAVPKQREFALESELQPQGSTSKSASSPRRAARPAPAKAPPVLIYRGLNAQQATP